MPLTWTFCFLRPSQDHMNGSLVGNYLNRRGIYARKRVKASARQQRVLRLTADQLEPFG